MRNTILYNFKKNKKNVITPKKISNRFCYESCK